MNSTNKAMTRAREEFIWNLRIKGYSERRIQAEMAKPENSALHENGKGMSQPAIHKTLKRIEKRTLERLDTDVEAMKRRQTLMIERSIEDLRDAYEQSTKPITHQKQKSGSQGNSTEVGARGRVGDHSILREIREHLSDLRKIWGADAPIKTDASIHGSVTVGGQDLSRLSDDELMQFQALYSKLTGAQDSSPTT